VLVTVDGVPRSYVLLADPGATDDPLLTTLALRRAGEAGNVRERATRKLADRMGAVVPAASRPTCSVVICTHRRPQFVAAALAAIKSLDPPADEIIVVDNAPGDLDCETIAELADVRYVREERRGQDWARAAGLAHATCELVAFTDDDVIVSRVWLRPLAELFADESVGAATGVAVGRELETPAQELRESFAGFVPGMTRRNHDWTNLRPVASGAAGAGANMIFRRELMLELGDVFPPELDGGTPTRSGGDLFALYRVLAAGRRIAFDPSLYAEHRHRAEYEALRETVLGYGTGFSSFLTKVLIERRELPALLAWWWLVNHLVAAVLWEPLLPYPGLIELRVDYLRGGFRGPAAWLRSRRGQQDRTQPGLAAEAHAIPDRIGLDEPSVTIISEAAPGARNSAAARMSVANTRDPLLLFLEPNCVPSPDLAQIHAECHRRRSGERIVIGRTATYTRSEGLAAQLAALWWQDHFNAKRTAATLTFADLTPGNFSLPRSLFERLGGFDERLATGAAAHELGVRALEAGIALEYEPRAEVRRVCGTEPPGVDTRETLASVTRAGRDHAALAALHPVTLASLPAVVPPIELHHRAVGFGLGRLPVGPLLAVGTAVADALEWCRFRRAWRTLFGWLASAAYSSGYAAARGPRSRPPAIELDIAADDPIPAPAVAPPLIKARLGARRVGTFRPRGGQWGCSVAEQALGHLDEEGWRLLARSPLDEDRTNAPGPEPVDLHGTLVVYGPANQGGDDRHAAELIASGARISRASGSVRDHWEVVARLVAEADEPHVALTLPGVSGTPEWLQTARAPLAGPRVAAVFGVGVPNGHLPLPTILASLQTVRGHHHDVAVGSQYAVLSRQHLEQVGGIDPTTASFGMSAPFLDLMERMLDSGFVVAHQETPGLEPPGSARPARSRIAWSNSRARGGLVTRDAFKHGPIGAAAVLVTRLFSEPVLVLAEALTLGRPSLRSVAGTTAGRLAGCLHACATFHRWRNPPPARPGTVAEPRQDQVVA
jgi:glycosyltransferase involved in cell wall biosynthesis